MTFADRIEALSEALELPQEAVGGACIVKLAAGKQALIENHKGILSFENTQIVIAAGKGRIVLRGDGLYLAAMSADRLLISGRICSVEWE